MAAVRIVMDTNVLLAALMSRRGKSFMLLSLIGQPSFEFCLSPPLCLEYEAVLKRMIGEKDIDTVIDYLCGHAQLLNIYYLWRPYLSDPKDDMLLEVAVSGNCQFIVTFNLNDFKGVEQFGIEPVKPADFLKRIGVLP